MTNLDVKILGSSSRGNCYLLKTSNENLLLECGVHYKDIMHSLNYDLSKIHSCLVSHEHGDHSKTASKLAAKGINIYSSKETLKALKLEGHRYKQLEVKKQVRLGEFTVMPFDVQHDSANPFGYLIYHKEIGKILFVTDTYYVKYKFKGINYFMIECNYDLDIVDSNIKKGKLNPIVRRRLLKSHFSLGNVKEFLLANDLSATKQIFLLHLSDGNSNADMFKSEIEKLTGIPTVIA